MEKLTWKPVNLSKFSPLKPSARWGHSSCVIGDEIVLFGGYADSIYMNDIWVFSTSRMEWSQIKTTGQIPSRRSNCSFNYDAANNQIVMFGGGGSNKTRHNSINLLNWQTKVWTEISFAQNQQAPWERTYHSAELLYPYLIVYGGEGVADLDDLWVYNFKNSKWTEVQMQKNAVRPCARRFHSSCLIGNEFFVIAGCHSKYRCLSDIFSIDFTHLLESGKFEGLKWRERQIKGSHLLTRWGHASAGFDKNIYIFGGRFSNDLNDVIIFNAESDVMRTVKVSSQTLPKPRRRPCISFIGSCMVMFGGFNQQYYNDLHFINLENFAQKPKKFAENTSGLLKLVNNSHMADHRITAADGEHIFCHKGLLIKNFASSSNLENFLFSLEFARKKKEELVNVLEQLYLGYGKNQILSEFNIDLPETPEQKQRVLIKYLQNSEQAPITKILSSAGNSRPANNNVVELSDEQFGEFLQHNRRRIHKDVTFIVNDQYVLESSAVHLRLNSKYFNNILSGKWGNCSQKRMIKINVPTFNIVLLEVIMNFLLHNYMIVPEKMSYISWTELYGLADYLSLGNAKEICLRMLVGLINPASVNYLFAFSEDENISLLAEACASFKIKQQQSPMNPMNRYIENAYARNRFQIEQRLMEKQSGSMMKKPSSCSTGCEGQKQNYQVYNQ